MKWIYSIINAVTVLKSKDGLKHETHLIDLINKLWVSFVNPHYATTLLANIESQSAQPHP